MSVMISYPIHRRVRERPRPTGPMSPLACRTVAAMDLELADKVAAVRVRASVWRLPVETDFPALGG
jgi:hypothetical protein